MMHRPTAVGGAPCIWSRLMCTTKPGATVLAEHLQRMHALLEDASSWASKVRPSSVTAGGVDQATGLAVGMLDRVYANSAVDMADIDAIGFDYDHTMVEYKKQLNHRIYDLALQWLIAKGGYPAAMRETSCKGFDPKHVIRGLAVDQQTGILVKLSYASRVVKARRGHQWLSPAQITQIFGYDGQLPAAVRDARLHPLNDLYALATGSLLGDVIEHHERAYGAGRYQPTCLVTDVMAAVADVHTSFAIHKEVLASLPSTELVAPAGELRDVLLQLRAAGKRLFIVTNSPLWYIEPQMELFVGRDWRQLFDAIVVSARKPRWFDDGQLQESPLREVLADGTLGVGRVRQIQRGVAYAHGSADELIALTGWATRRVLYLGDHLYADLAGARRGRHNWVTGAVIAEVRDEMLRANTSEYRELVFRNHVLDATLQLVQEAVAGREASAEELQLIHGLDEQRRRGLEKQNEVLNTDWGSVFHANDVRTTTFHAASLFGFALRRHADLYMAKLENIAPYTVRRHRFAPPIFTMPHEVTPYVDPVVEHIAGSKLVGSPVRISS